VPERHHDLVEVGERLDLGARLGVFLFGSGARSRERQGDDGTGESGAE
jgi:hypothetical protein